MFPVNRISLSRKALITGGIGACLVLVLASGIVTSIRKHITTNERDLTYFNLPDDHLDDLDKSGKLGNAWRMLKEQGREIDRSSLSPDEKSIKKKLLEQFLSDHHSELWTAFGSNLPKDAATQKVVDLMSEKNIDELSRNAVEILGAIPGYGESKEFREWAQEYQKTWEQIDENNRLINEMTQKSKDR